MHSNVSQNHQNIFRNWQIKVKKIYSIQNIFTLFVNLIFLYSSADSIINSYSVNWNIYWNISLCKCVKIFDYNSVHVLFTKMDSKKHFYTFQKESFLRDYYFFLLDNPFQQKTIYLEQLKNIYNIRINVYDHTEYYSLYCCNYYLIIYDIMKNKYQIKLKRLLIDYKKFLFYLKNYI